MRRLPPDGKGVILARITAGSSILEVFVTFAKVLMAFSVTRSLVARWGRALYPALSLPLANELNERGQER
jgi:hypothetical protein